MWKAEANDQFLPQLLRFTYAFECFACVYIYALFVCLVLIEVRYSGTGVTEVCESHRVLGGKSGPLQEQVFVATKPSP